MRTLKNQRMFPSENPRVGACLAKEWIVKQITEMRPQATDATSSTKFNCSHNRTVIADVTLKTPIVCQQLNEKTVLFLPIP